MVETVGICSLRNRPPRVCGRDVRRLGAEIGAEEAPAADYEAAHSLGGALPRRHTEVET